MRTSVWDGLLERSPGRLTKGGLSGWRPIHWIGLAGALFVFLLLFVFALEVATGFLGG